MTENEQPRGESVRVDSAAELLEHTELAEIRTYALSAERHDSQETEQANIAVSVRTEPAWLETRCRLTLATDDATLVVDRSAIFTHRAPIEASDTAIREFVERVGVMSVYPYLREGVFTLAGNLGVSAPVMALIRAGQVRLDLTRNDPTQPAEQQTPAE